MSWTRESRRVLVIARLEARRSVAAALAPHWTVREAETPEAARAATRRTAFDAVVADAAGLSGPALRATVRALGGPVVLIAPAETADQAAHAGASEVVASPFTSRDLRAAVARARWTRLGYAGHACFFEHDARHVAAADHLAVGLRRREGAVAIVTAERWLPMRERLEEHGVNTPRALANGQLVWLDAEAVVDALDLPRLRLFRSMVRRLLGRMRRFESVRLYGEAVGVLARRGQVEDALRLERMWNQVRRGRRLAVLCGYPAGVPRAAALGRTHTQVVRIA